MSSFMDGLEAETYDRTYQDRQLLHRIIGYFRPHRKIMILIIVCIICSALLNIAYPIFISNTLDTLVLSHAMQTIPLLIIVILFSSILSWICNLFRQWLTAQVVGDIVLKLRKDAFIAVMKQDMSFFDTFSSGKIVSRVASDTRSFATVVSLILNLFSQGLVFLLIVVVLFFISWQLALLTCTILPAIILVTLGFRTLARRVTRRTQRSIANMNANVQESISGITIAKNFRREAWTYKKFQQLNDQLYQVNMRTNFLYICVFPLFATIANIGNALVIYFGGSSVLHQTLSIGEWFLFVQSIGLLWNPLTSISSFWSQFQLGLSASERVFALLDVKPYVQQTSCQSVPELTGKIEFKNLFFRYDERQTVLTDFSLTIHPGEIVAFVGHTGAGKTSIGRLIARFYEFQEGQLLIDGYDIRTFNLQEYRHHLGIVTQTPFLFSGTVADNIRYASPQASDNEVLAAAQHIGGGDWLRTLPNGMQTSVGEGGKLLSLGQRQLIALARVLLQDPTILIMDEATASVDPLTEVQIQEGLNVVLKNRTAILIAHRLSTIKHADRIIVLNQGQIVEEGNHEILLQQHGYYAHLYNTYFRHQSPDYQPQKGFVAVVFPDKIERSNPNCD